MHNAHKWERTHDNTTAQHTQAHTKKLCRHKQGGGHQRTTSKLSLKSLQHQEHGGFGKALHRGLSPPKSVFLNSSSLFEAHTSSFFQPMPAVDPLPLLLLTDLNVLLDVHAWKGRDRHSWKQKKGGRHRAHGAKGGGRMKQNRTDTHQWVMGRRDRKATTFISSYNRRMGGHNSMKRRAFKQKQQRMFVQQCQHMLFWLEQQNNLKYKGCFLHA